MIQEAAHAAVEGLSSADTTFHAIVGAVVTLMGAKHLVEVLQWLGVVPERSKNARSASLSELQVSTIVRKEMESLTVAIGTSTERQCDILGQIRDDIRLVAEDTRQRQIAARIEHQS